MISKLLSKFFIHLSFHISVLNGAVIPLLVRLLKNGEKQKSTMYIKNTISANININNIEKYIIGGVLICVVGFLQLTARKMDDTLKYQSMCFLVVL